MKNDYVLNHVSVNESRLMYIFFKKFNITHNVEDTGIGLGISKYLVQSMCSSIGVENAPGNGSTFWIELALSIRQA